MTQADQHIAAVFGWNEYRVVAFQQSPGGDAQLGRRQRRTVGTDYQRLTLPAKSAKGVEHACAEIGAPLRIERDAKLLRAADGGRMVAIRRAAQGYRPQVRGKRSPQRPADQGVLQRRRVFGAKAWDKARLGLAYNRRARRWRCRPAWLPVQRSREADAYACANRP